MAVIENATWYAITLLGVAVIGIGVAWSGRGQTTRIYHGALESPPTRRASRVLLSLESVIEMWLFVIAFLLLLVSTIIRVIWDSTESWSVPMTTVFQLGAWAMVIAACAIKQLWWIIEQRVLAENAYFAAEVHVDDPPMASVNSSVVVESPGPATIEVRRPE